MMKLDIQLFAGTSSGSVNTNGYEGRSVIFNWNITKQDIESNKTTFKYTSCCDEIFLQTIVYNSKYFDNLYLKQDNSYKANQRYIDWTRGEPYTFKINDYDELIKSDMLFARKFSTKIDKEIVDKIYDYVRGVK